MTTDALGRETNYTYDANSRRTAMVYRHGVAAIDYGYENGRLATLDRKTFRSGAEQHQIYSFGYNQWGRDEHECRGPRPLDERLRSARRQPDADDLRQRRGRDLQLRPPRPAG